VQAEAEVKSQKDAAMFQAKLVQKQQEMEEEKKKMEGKMKLL